MRIHASTIGLAAYILDIADAADTPTNTVISFSALGTPPVLKNDDPVRWTKSNSSIAIQKAVLVRNGDDTLIGSQSASTNAKGMSESERRGLATHNQKVGKDVINPYMAPGFTLNTTSENTMGNIVLDYNAEWFNSENYTMTPVYLRIDWSLDDASEEVGSSYSPLFALTNATGATVPNSLTQELMDSNGHFNSPAYGECTGDYDCGQSTASGSGLPPSTATAAVSTNPAGTSSTAESSANTGGGSSGLSIGAIAGIAVACGLVGLALIGAAVWFMCFRRPRTSHAALGQNGGYASDGVGAIMADKELPHVTDSPHSAYAVDRNQLRDPHEAARNSMVESAGIGAGTGLINGSGHVAHGGDDTYTPYSDHSPPAGVSARGLGSEGTGPMDSQTSLPTGGARSPTPPISTRYAHLVEEGMTDAEIRRLEEEERALDMAIEDAGRSSRAQ